jgi:hypothetical protein
MKHNHILVLEINRNHRINRTLLSFKEVKIIDFAWVKYKGIDIPLKPHLLSLTMIRNFYIPVLVVDENCKVLDISKLFNLNFEE